MKPTALIFILFSLTFSHLGFTDASNLPNKPHLIVNGVGVIEQIPDQIIISFEVSATAKDFSQAKDQVDRIVGKAIKAAKNQQINDEDINASKINASAQYEWNNQTRIYKGEQVSRQVTIKLSEAQRYNDLVEGLLAANITRLQPVQLQFSEQTKLENIAMTKALDDAKQQAETIVGHMGVKLGKIFQISPADNQPMMHRLAMRASDESHQEKAGLELGKQAVEQRVRIIYLLNQ